MVRHLFRGLRTSWVFLAFCLGVPGCGLEAELFGPVLDKGHVQLPHPRDTILHGQATSLSGGLIAAYTASGRYLADASISESGSFELRFDGASEHRGMVLWATKNDQVALGVLPELPRQPTVFHEERHVYAWDQHALLGDLNVTSTTVSVVALRASQRVGVGLDAVGPGTISSGLDLSLIHI